MNDEMSIDLVNLFEHILEKWRIILCVSLFSAVVGGMIGIVKGEGPNSSSFIETGTSVSDPESMLTDEQIENVKLHFTQITAYDRAIDDQRRLNDESYIMSLDPSEAVVYDMQYLFETDINNPAEAYSKNILSEDDYTKIAGFVGPDIGKEGLDESIYFITDATELSQPNDMGHSYKLLLTVGIIAPDKGTCEQMINVLDSAVRVKTELLKDKGAFIESELVSGRYGKNARDLVVELQQKKINALGTLITSRSNYINNTVSRVNETEKAYLDSLLSSESYEPHVNTSQEGIDWKKTVKDIITGILVGLFLSLCWGTFTYIVSGRLHSAEELAESFGIPVLNTLLPNSSDTLDMLIEEFNNLIEKNAVKKVYIATDKMATSAAEVAGNISERLSKDISGFVGGIVPDVDDMKQLITSDGVFIIPVIDITKTKTVRNFIQICGRNDKYIVGSSPLKEMRK